ncbi:C4-dicarboxylate transporter/malic acid transport protein [Auriculariales sp. MPI-PUGE-AT-0066]|nr:C4-dicarboxylate transporter/malic acid transport protein [Auriculariales sp. MPI-PUGE-AT-0066]
MAADLTERAHYRTLADVRNILDLEKSQLRHRFSRALRNFLPNPPPAQPNSSSSSLQGEVVKQYEKRNNLTWKERLEFFEFGFFTLNLGTGACTILIGNISFHFPAKQYIGYVFLALNCIIYLTNLTLLALKAWWHPAAFRRSFVVPGSALFFPTTILAFATIYMSFIIFVHPHVTSPVFIDVMYVLFWIYVAMSVFCAALLQWTMYDQAIPQDRDFETITPSECLPVFPMMLAGAVGSTLANIVEDRRAIPLIMLSYAFQGCGFLTAQLKLSAWMSRNVLFGHPHDTRAVPIFFMSVGPPGFTAIAFLNLGQRALEVFPRFGVLQLPLLLPNNNAGEMVFVASWLTALCVWGQCFWFILATSVIWVQSLLRADKPIGWGMAWFATTFPLGASLSSR